MTRWRQSRERGFTLVELLVVIVLLGIIMTPLANSAIVALQNNNRTNAMFAESHDAQISAAYWAMDVSAVGVRGPIYPYALGQSIELNALYNSGLYPCGAGGTPPAVVRLAGDSFVSAGAVSTIVRVSYVVEPTTGAAELHRIRCVGSPAPISDDVVAHDLDPSTPPSLSCSSSCTAATIPQTITLTLAIHDPQSTSSPYVVQLVGNRRQS